MEQRERGEIINKSVSQFVILKYLAGNSFPGLYCWGGFFFFCKSHSGRAVKRLFHLCPPAPADEGADGLVRPRSTGVEVGAVPRLDQTNKVGAFTLDKGEKRYSNMAVLKEGFLKEPDVRRQSHLSTLSCHLTFSLSFSRCWPVDLQGRKNV